MSNEARVLSVEDCGVWRGRRTWEVRVEDKRGTVRCSVPDVETSEAACTEALVMAANRRTWTDDDRAATAAASAAFETLR